MEPNCPSCRVRISLCGCPKDATPMQADSCRVAAPYECPREPHQVAADVAGIAQRLREYQERARAAEYALVCIGRKTQEVGTLATVLETLPADEAKRITQARSQLAG